MSGRNLRIVERGYPDGRREFVIQKRRRFIFWTWWDDAWLSSSLGALCCDSFSTLEEAEASLWQFGGRGGKQPTSVVRGEYEGS